MVFVECHVHMNFTDTDSHIFFTSTAFLILKIEPVCLFEACVLSLSVILILLHG